MTDRDRCLLCGRELPRRRWWQRLVNLSAPTCASAGLDEATCQRGFRVRMGLEP